MPLLSAHRWGTVPVIQLARTPGLFAHPRRPPCPAPNRCCATHVPTSSPPPSRWCCLHRFGRVRCAIPRLLANMAMAPLQRVVRPLHVDLIIRQGTIEATRSAIPTPPTAKTATHLELITPPVDKAAARSAFSTPPAASAPAPSARALLPAGSPTPARSVTSTELSATRAALSETSIPPVAAGTAPSASTTPPAAAAAARLASATPPAG